MSWPHDTTRGRAAMTPGPGPAGWQGPPWPADPGAPRGAPKNAPRGPRGAGLVVLALSAIVPVVLIGWLVWQSVLLPRALAREFVDVVASGDIARARGRLSPDRRAQYSDRAIGEWAEALRGYDELEWGRKSSLGTTRGGRSLSSIGGFVHYPNSAEERSFRLVCSKDGGEWYIDSFTLGARAVPR